MRELEPRCLLTGPSAVWLGQDCHDLAGPSSTLAPDDVQDIHIKLEGLPADRTIVKADVTGYGGGEWTFNDPSHWAAALVRTHGATTADLFIEPYQVETGRTFFVTLTDDNSNPVSIQFAGGTADPNLRMPGTELTAAWINQDGQDWTGPSPAVGPDGIQDTHIALGNLSACVGVGIQSVAITGPGVAWNSGINPGKFWNAEAIPHPNDPTKADLFFTSGDLYDLTLTVTVAYTNGKTDDAMLTAGHTDPTLRMPAPASIPLTWNGFSAQWAGQDGQNPVGPGDVHVALSGLPAGRKVVAALLNDPTRIDWSYAVSGTAQLDPSGLSLAFRPSATDPTKADIYFSPIRDESGANLTLRLVLDDGTMLATSFAATSPSDPGLRSPAPASSSITANPGDDLNALANQYGTVHLAVGTYLMAAPLVLTHPVTINADPGTTLLFSQAANAPTWTAAIKIMAGHTTLDGFAVRFAGPVHWTDDISYGPAVIGTTDNFDPNDNQPIEAITLTHLDLQSPPASTSWEEATRLMRLVSAQGGVVNTNTLKGGSIEFCNGPWLFDGNTYQGTLPNTYSCGVFEGHYTHDVTIANNTAQSVGPSGKTWRFLVLTQAGTNDLIQNNTVVGIGPQDSDTVPCENTPEVILTEAYQIHFEGMPSAISLGGRIVQISNAPGGAAQAGDVVSILTGPEAGQWRRIAQAISPTAYLLDSPLPAGSYAISISTGFVNETFRENTVDSRGSTTAGDMVLAGNQFGAQVLNNHLLGGSTALLVAAYATESPVCWGWSHAPFLGATIAGNTIEDSVQGALLRVDHGPCIKCSDVGRVYLSGTLANNVGIWSDAFLARRALAGATSQPVALTIGDSTTADPAELVLSAQGNQVQGPASVVAGATMQVNAATINGQSMTDQGVVLPTTPSA